MSDSTTTDPRPAALDAARHTAQAVRDVGAKFMLDMDMYGEVAGLGYQGLGFYIAGRGGVLGDVEHVEVFEAMKTAGVSALLGPVHASPPMSHGDSADFVWIGVTFHKEEVALL